MTQPRAEKIYAIEVGKIFYDERKQDLVMVKEATMIQNISGPGGDIQAAKACVNGYSGVIVMSDDLDGICTFAAQILSLEKEKEAKPKAKRSETKAS